MIRPLRDDEPTRCTAGEIRAMQAEWEEAVAERDNLRAVLLDVKDWMDHIEGEGRLRRSQVQERIAAAVQSEATYTG